MANAENEQESTAKKGGRRSKTGTAKKTRTELRQAVQREVKKRSDDLAKSLVDKAVAGSSGSVNTILRVLDGQVKEEEEKSARRVPSGPSPAELLAKEEEWQEDELENLTPPRERDPVLPPEA